MVLSSARSNKIPVLGHPIMVYTMVSSSKSCVTRSLLRATHLVLFSCILQPVAVLEHHESCALVDTFIGPFIEEPNQSTALMMLENSDWL